MKTAGNILFWLTLDESRKNTNNVKKVSMHVHAQGQKGFSGTCLVTFLLLFLKTTYNSLQMTGRQLIFSVRFRVRSYKLEEGDI